MKTKHTKGEWEVNSQGNLVVSGKKWISDLFIYGFEYISQDERKANAKLIAASPLMLNTLIKIKELGGFSADGEIGLLINNAIKKATE
jgi:hypothetical protein